MKKGESSVAYRSESGNKLYLYKGRYYLYGTGCQWAEHCLECTQPDCRYDTKKREGNLDFKGVIAGLPEPYYKERICWRDKNGHE